MKIRHNKKRNTAFIYESLIKEATAAIIKNDPETKRKITFILKKHFSEGSVLRRHLECYRSLYETANINKEMAQRILREAKMASRLLDAEGLFLKQSDLIDDVNKQLPENSVYNTFIPNYKALATIDQIFSNKLSPKNSVILENQIIDIMTANNKSDDSDVVSDSFVYNSFVNKFNERYETELLKEQKTLLNYYISSFADNSLSLKTFLNEEIARLKKTLIDSLSTEHIERDTEMIEKTNKIVEKLNSFYNQDINDNVLLTVLRTQKLVKEIFEDADSD
jgi:hypothetical protein